MLSAELKTFVAETEINPQQMNFVTAANQICQSTNWNRHAGGLS
jgi:hypothetical protein